MFQALKKLFTKPSAKVIATTDLEEAKRQLLASQAAAEYHSNMVKYYEQVVRRLTVYVKAEEV